MRPGEPVSPQDLLLTILGTYVRPYGRPVWSGGLVEVLAEFGFSEGAARVALTRLVRRGLLDRSRSGRLVYYTLTARASRVLAEGDGRIFGLGRPRPAGSSDGWTWLWHMLPESRRLEQSRLARRLRFLGFGSVQDGVWVSPHDHVGEVQRLVGDLDVSAYVTVFVGAPAVGVDALVARAWDLSGLADRYAGFVDVFGRYVGRGGRPRRVGSDFEAFMVRTRLIHAWRGFPALDPELPEPVAPLGAARGRAVAVFDGLFEGLRERSERHFEAMAGSSALAA